MTYPLEPPPVRPDPDPLTVDPEPVRRQLPDPDDRASGYVVLALVGLILALLAAAWFVATPRSAPQPDDARPVGFERLSGAPSVPVSGGAPRRISGLATWYCSVSSACTRGYDPGDLVAAIDRDLGFAKGDRIRVSAFGNSVVVTIVDVCQCAGDRLVDLTSGAFRRLAPLDLGVIPVMLELADGDAPTGPPTDVAP